MPSPGVTLNLVRSKSVPMIWPVRHDAGGGDGGLTRAATRAACGLPADSVGHGVAPPPGAGVAETVAARRVPGWLLGDEEGLVRCHVSLVKHCLERGWGFCSESHVSRLHQDVCPRVPARDRVATLRQLKARGWWKELPPRGRSGGAADPAHSHGVLDLFPPVPDGAESVAHRETLSADPCVSWCECVALIRHLVKLQSPENTGRTWRG